MLWGGVDETAAELFVCHPQAGKFEGNLQSALSVEIGDSKYGPDEMPSTM